MEELEFVDAQQMHLEHPKTFDAPSIEELGSLQKHDTVKVCVGNERFWTEIIDIEGEKITAIVVNQLVSSDEHGLVFGDTIEFEKRHIYSTWWNSPNIENHN